MQIILQYHQVRMSQQKPSLFGNYFNLHPQDAYRHAQYLTGALESFTNAFKERIQVEIDYSKSLLKVGKKLQKFINPDEPTPLSYISSAFKVEHQQRARHALELAEYLHTEIQILCEDLLEQHQNELKRIEKDLKKLYKEGQSVEESYQKCLKKFYRTKQDWEERMISKSILNYTPGATPAQKEKAIARLEEDKKQNDQNQQKYLQSLQVFNQFAERYNHTISPYLKELEVLELEGISEQSDCIRKLIVSEVNMFKNIQYDLLNISKQMEAIVPNSQIECFVISNKDVFELPIISLYSEGPIMPNRYEIIDFKSPIKRTLLEQTLLRIDNSLFTWQLQNKSNSTLRYAVQRLLKRYQQSEAGDNDFLQQFQNSINSNRTVKQIPLDGVGKQKYLNIEQVYSLCLEIVSGIAQFLKAQQLYQHKIKSLMELLEGYLSLHHFYRFIAFLALDEYQNLHDQIVTGKITTQHYIVLIRLLLDKTIKAKDIFIARLTVVLLFTARYTSQQQQKFYYQHPSIQDMDIWQDRDFWQAVIFEETYELITNLPTAMKQTELKDVYLMRQKNVIFSGLLPYAHYMIMLGEQVSQTRSIMGRICQIYNLYEEQERDISKTIAQSFNQYKAMQE